MMLLALAAAIASPAEPCTLPKEHWDVGPPGGHQIDSMDLVVWAGRITWDGKPIDEATLRRYAREAAALPTRPRINLYAGTTDCAELRRVAALVAIEARCTPRDCVMVAPPPRMTTVAGPSQVSTVQVPLTTRARRLAPLVSPSNWISNDDYPMDALLKDMAGVVAFRLDVGADGVPYDCVITTSSGHDALDAWTCTLMMQRARFVPALDEAGKAAPGTWSSRMHWELPVDEPLSVPKTGS